MPDGPFSQSPSTSLHGGPEGPAQVFYFASEPSREPAHFIDGSALQTFDELPLLVNSALSRPVLSEARCEKSGMDEAYSAHADLLNREVTLASQRRSSLLSDPAIVVIQ